MNRRNLLKQLALGVPAICAANTAQSLVLKQITDVVSQPDLMSGPFKPTWESLSHYQTPEWFRDAKFGMWAHWGPQCQPEFGDWYARSMYMEGSSAYKHHVKTYGHPSKFGFKDVINEWKADQWDPNYLVSLYKKAGAKYFMGMANHHDNLDLYHSRYQKWNSVNMGPKKDIIGGWSKAAKENGLPFGVSVHASRTWNWYEPAQESDEKGPLAGVPYDGNTMRSEGNGKWWQGYEPQDLYSQRHPVSKRDKKALYLTYDEWTWRAGITPPSEQFKAKFYNRTIDLINRYNPDMVYFDDTVLPFWPIDETGLKIVAYMYNHSIKKHGKLNAVVTGKSLEEMHRKCLVWDFERSFSNKIEPLPWQTDTCLGDWHYSREIYERNSYKTPTNVIQTLIDVVSKNGNLMLNVPVRGNGSIDEKELAIVEGITAWMSRNGEAIYATRPWKVAGEGPAFKSSKENDQQSVSGEGGGPKNDSKDIRFTQKGDALFAFILGKPTTTIPVKSLAKENFKTVSSVKLVATGEQVNFKQDEKELSISLPSRGLNDIANVFQIR